MATKTTEPVVKQVDVMGLMGALRTNGKAKLSDFATPIESETNNENNNQNSTTMAQNVKAADLIGKVIIVGDNQGTITVKGVQDNGMLACEFSKAGEDATTPMAVTLPNLQKMTERGLWKIQTSEVTTEADVQEVQDIVPVVTKKEKTHSQPLPVSEGSEKPVAIVKPMETKPKAEPKPKAKTQTSCVPLVASEQSSSADLKPQTSVKVQDSVAATGKLTYATYEKQKTNKTTGKPYTVTHAKIMGFAATDEAYQRGVELHGAVSGEMVDGVKVLGLYFSHRYAAAAKLVCDALNAGKPFAECVAIIDNATEENARKREEWKAKIEERKQKREERKAAKNQSSAVSPQTSGEKTYTLDEVATMLGKLLPDGAASTEDIKKLLKAA